MIAIGSTQGVPGSPGAFFSLYGCLTPLGLVIFLGGGNSIRRGSEQE